MKTPVILIQKVQQGDEKAFQELFQLLYKYVYFTAYQVCKNDDDAKEATQLTFLQIHKSIGNLQDPKTFDVWMHRITVNKCYNLFSKRRDKVFDPETSEKLRVQKEMRRYMNPSDEAHFQNDREVLLHLLEELPEKYRTILTLMYFDQHSLTELSQILELPEGTVKSRLFAARNLLKRKVEAYESVNGISLNFNEATMSTLLVSAFAFGFQKLSLSIPIFTIAGIGAHANWLSHLIGGGSAKGIAIVALSTIAGVGVYAGYEAIQNNITKEEPMLSHNVVNNEKKPMLDNEVKFQPVVIGETSYETPQDAYYSLLHWAHCDVELNELSKEELSKFKPLYDALKYSNGSYYQELQENGWGTAFEKLVK